MFPRLQAGCVTSVNAKRLQVRRVTKTHASSQSLFSVSTLANPVQNCVHIAESSSSRVELPKSSSSEVSRRDILRCQRRTGRLPAQRQQAIAPKKMDFMRFLEDERLLLRLDDKHEESCTLGVAVALYH